MEEWDVIVVGAGSAGMSAGIYAARFNLKTLILGQEVGGLLNESHNVENYPGYKSIPGLDLMMKFKEHVDNLEVPTINEWVVDILKHDYDNPREARFEVVTDDGTGKRRSFSGRTLIFATGAKHKKLNAKGEERLAGRGVSYCATCDAAFFRDVPVAIVGGGDSAALAGNLVAEFASKVHMIVRKDALRAEPINRMRLEKNPKVVFLYGTEVLEVLGEQEVEAVHLSKPYEGKDVLPLKGLFIEIGQVVQSELAEKIGVTLNAKREIVINERSETNLRGVYAAGDVGNREYKQAITGASEGAVAAFGAYALLKKIDEDEDVQVSY